MVDNRDRQLRNEAKQGPKRNIFLIACLQLPLYNANLLCLCGCFYAREYQVDCRGEVLTYCTRWRVDCSLIAFTIFTCIVIVMYVCACVCARII